MTSSTLENCSKERCCDIPSTSSTRNTQGSPYSREEDAIMEESCSRLSASSNRGDTTPIVSTGESDKPQACTSCSNHNQDQITTTGFELELRPGKHGSSDSFRRYDEENATMPVDDGRCHGSSCTIISTTPQSIDESSKSACCCTSQEEIRSTRPASRRLQATDSAPKSSVAPNVDKVDLEIGLPGTQRIVLQIQGMTCTGCEKKLLNLLSSLPEVSGVKTSLLLAQAEFDLRPSGSVDVDNIASAVQKMTGFSCTKVVNEGEELELVVEGDAHAYAEGWPAFVIDLTVINKDRVRVSYDPKEIGSRALLSDPFFQRAVLAPPSPAPLIATGRAHLWKSFCLTLCSIACTIPVLVLAWAQIPRHDVLYGAVSLVLATLVQVAVAGPFYARAFKSLIFSRMIEMDLLIVLSSTTAYIYSVVAYTYLTAGQPLVTGEFFETSTLLVTLIMVGRSVSAFARQRAVESIMIESLQPNTAILIDQENAEEKEIDARLLHYGDIFKVHPDMSIVTDGIVMAGESEVDESLITGEVSLIPKWPGEAVTAGSINHSGTLKVKVTRLPCENTIKTISAMVDEAKSSKSKVQELADSVASYFVPAILVVTMVVFVVWVAIGKYVRLQSTTTSSVAAMTYAISVLIVSCPCAIGLAVPMVVVIAGGVAARQGLIFKTAETIDTARKVSHVIFDKTGTLTKSELCVVEEEFITVPSSFEPSLILGVTTDSKHPVATAVATHLRASGVEPLIIDHIVSIPGKGIEATWSSHTVRGGNPYWLDMQHHPSVRKILALNLTVFCVTLDSSLIAVYGVQDFLRPSALPTIISLRQRGIEISLVSGDAEGSVLALASRLGIPRSNVLAGCTPAQKQDYVRSLLTPQHPNHKHKPIVLFCGDGTNDAPSLAQASIGVHLNEGTEVAASAADAVIMRPSLAGIITLVELSEAFHRRVVFNFAWSFVYNLFAMLLAAGAFPTARILPQYAGLGEAVSVVPVIAVAVGLRWKKF